MDKEPQHIPIKGPTGLWRIQRLSDGRLCCKYVRRTIDNPDFFPHLRVHEWDEAGVHHFIGVLSSGITDFGPYSPMIWLTPEEVAEVCIDGPL